jgi:hypothetical protein
MSKALNKAILARLNGTEVLTGAQATAQGVVSGDAVGYGTMTLNGVLPATRFYEDAGTEVMPRAVDVGIINQSIYRFEKWSRSMDGSLFGAWADALEQLFDERRNGPALTLEGNSQVFESSLFVPLQAPFFDERINSWFGLIAFKFIESRV